MHVKQRQLRQMEQ